MDNRLSRRHVSSTEEVRSLFAVVDRQLRDAMIPEVSNDGRFTAAYEAALQLATILVRASGRRIVTRPGHHEATFDALPKLLGGHARPLADYFNSCRKHRNTISYHRVDVVTESQVGELIRDVNAFKVQVIAWLQANHPELLET